MKIEPTRSSSSNDQSSRPSLHRRTESGLKLTKGEARRRPESFNQDASDQDASKPDSNSGHVYFGSGHGEHGLVEEPGQNEDNNTNTETGTTQSQAAQSSSTASGRVYHTRSKSGSSQSQAQSASQVSTHGYNTRSKSGTSADGSAGK